MASQRDCGVVALCRFPTEGPRVRDPACLLKHRPFRETLLTHSKLVRVSLLLFVPLLSGLATTASAQVQWETSAGVEYTTGSYGGTDATKVLYAPLSVGVVSSRWRFAVALPYVQLEGPGGTVSGGVVVPGTGPSVRQSGFGDISVGAAYQLVEPVSGRTQWELAAAVKIPTAGDNLGTGEADYSLQLAARQPVSDRFTLLASVGYQWLGDPAAFDLQDGPSATAGVNFAAAQGRNLGVQVSYRHPFQDGLEAQAVLNPYYRTDFSNGWSLTGSGTVGLTASSPDYGAGFSVGRSF